MIRKTQPIKVDQRAYDLVAKHAKATSKKLKVNWSMRQEATRALLKYYER
jgi:hypothetical protein